MSAPPTHRPHGAGRDHTHHQPEEQHVTAYRIEFGKVGDTYPVPELTITEDDPTAFSRAIAAYAIPHLTPVLTELGHPEYADCFFRVSSDRSMGEFWWLDLTAGTGARFCPARITPSA